MANHKLLKPRNQTYRFSNPFLKQNPNKPFQTSLYHSHSILYILPSPPSLLPYPHHPPLHLYLTLSSSPTTTKRTLNINRPASPHALQACTSTYPPTNISPRPRLFHISVIHVTAIHSSILPYDTKLTVACAPSE